MSNLFSREEIQARYESLPPDIQKAVSDDSTARGIEEIGRRKGLRIDSVGILIEYSCLVMLGLIKSTDFVNNLKEQLGISHEQAESLAIDIDQQVFSRVRNSLREMQHHSHTLGRFAQAETPPRQDTPAEKVKSTELNESIRGAFASEDYSPAALKTTSPSEETPATYKVAPTATEVVSDKPISPNPSDKALDEISLAQRAPAPSEALAKDFKTRLEEQLAQQGNSQINADPYRESL